MTKKRVSPLVKIIVKANKKTKMQQDTFPGKKLTAADKAFASRRTKSRSIEKSSRRASLKHTLDPKSRGRRKTSRKSR